MKRALIITLVCLNVALVAAVMLVSTPPAQAQAVRGAPDYLMVTAAITAGNDGVFVLDMAQRRLGAWKYDKTARRMMPYRGRQLARDFQQAPQPAAPSGTGREGR